MSCFARRVCVCGPDVYTSAAPRVTPPAEEGVGDAAGRSGSALGGRGLPSPQRPLRCTAYMQYICTIATCTTGIKTWCVVCVVWWMMAEMAADG
jgi:hypothetical protein